MSKTTLVRHKALLARIAALEKLLLETKHMPLRYEANRKWLNKRNKLLNLPDESN